MPPEPLPVGFLADISNRRSVETRRFDARGNDFRINVSNLIQSDAQRKFCAREVVLSHFEERSNTIQGLTPGMELLFAEGNAIHDLVRAKYLKSSMADYAFGSWRCPCQATRLIAVTYADAKRAINCAVCGEPPLIYKELDLYLPKYHLTGHPDFIILWQGQYYLYEIKTIDRLSVVFDSMDAPLGDHTLQGSVYYFMMRELGYAIRQAVRYLYVDRKITEKLWRGSPYREFSERRSDDKRIRPFLDKLQGALDGIEKGILPARICSSVSCPRAKNCKVAVSCFSRKSDRVSADSRAGPQPNVIRRGPLRRLTKHVRTADVPVEV